MVPPWLPRLAVTAALLVVGGCATRAPPVLPLAGVPAPSQWAQPVPAGTRAAADWWQVFGDGTLVELVEAAQRGNTAIAQARANLRLARALRAQAAAASAPSLTASAGAQRSRGAAGASRNNIEAAFDAGWELDLFGATLHAVAAEDARVRASAGDLADAHVSIAAEAALAYLDLRGAQVRLAVARENLGIQEETLQISRWRQQAGLASSLEVEQGTSAVEQTRAQLPALQAAAARSAHALAVLTGQPPAALLQRLSAAAPVPQPREGVAVAIPAQALRQRPDVLAAEEQLRAAAEEVGAADALRKPSVQLGASLAWSGVTLGALGSAGAARSLLAAMVQPVLDGGRLDAQLAARRAAFDAAQEQYRARVLAALQEVEDALAALSADRERLASLQRALAAARNASLLASQRHASGLVDFQTVLDTQRTLLSVQDSVVVLETGLAADHVRLYKAIGGGWRNPEPLS